MITGVEPSGATRAGRSIYSTTVGFACGFQSGTVGAALRGWLLSFAGRVLAGPRLANIWSVQPATLAVCATSVGPSTRTRHPAINAAETFALFVTRSHRSTSVPASCGPIVSFARYVVALSGAGVVWPGRRRPISKRKRGRSKRRPRPTQLLTGARVPTTSWMISCSRPGTPAPVVRIAP